MLTESINGYHIAYTRSGNPNGEVMLLVHGITTYSFMLADNAEDSKKLHHLSSIVQMWNIIDKSQNWKSTLTDRRKDGRSYPALSRCHRLSMHRV